MEALGTDSVRKDVGSPPSTIPAIRQSISGRQYSCYVSDAGARLCDESNDNTQYEADIIKYLPLLTPKLTQKGKVAVRQPYIPKKTVKWWKAQCGFRGLAVGGTLRDLQDRAKVWLKRFLYESFITPGRSSKEALVVEVDDWGNKTEQLSSQMQLRSEMRKMPNHQTGQRLVVVGLDEEAVRSKFADIDRDARRSELRAQREREGREQESRDDFERQFSSAKSKGKGLKGKWDVSGNWMISCPYTEEQWGSEDDECSLEIRITEPTGSGLAQVYALFDFIAITGIIRFVDLDAYANTQDEGNKGNQTPERDLASDEGEDEDEDENDSAQFLLPNASMPSWSSRDFNFCWRGEETGENEIQLYSDQEVCSLTFESPNALVGVFKSDLTGSTDFKGFRDGFDDEVQRGGPLRRGEAAYSLDPSYDWALRSEAAYERARVGRWR
ncbi:MAG: hypothetical protein Q9160_004418 [Pyrenula sp. 1 TL-2023]